MKRILLAAVLTAFVPACSDEGLPDGHVMYGEWRGEYNVHFNGERTLQMSLSLAEVCQLVSTDNPGTVPDWANVEGAEVELLDMTATTIRFRTGDFDWAGVRAGNEIVGTTTFDQDTAYSAEWRIERIADVAGCIPIPPPPLPDPACVLGRWELQNTPGPEDETYRTYVTGGGGYLLVGETCYGMTWEVDEYTLRSETAYWITTETLRCFRDDVGDILLLGAGEDSLVYRRVAETPPCNDIIPWP